MQNPSPVLRCIFLARKSAKLIANFSATKVASLPSIPLSFSLSLSLSLSLYPSLSWSAPHAQYRKRFRASYNTIYGVKLVWNTIYIVKNKRKGKVKETQWRIRATIPVYIRVPMLNNWHPLGHILRPGRKFHSQWHFLLGTCPSKSSTTERCKTVQQCGNTEQSISFIF